MAPARTDGAAGDERPATADDVHPLCTALPHVTLGTSWGDAPTYLVSDPATKAKPRGFCLHRAPHDSALDPETGEQYDDLLVVRVPDEGAKKALVEDDGPFFTVPHFDGHAAVLVQQSRLGEISVAELREVLVDAWLSQAPPKLVKAFLADQPGAPDQPGASDPIEEPTDG